MVTTWAVNIYLIFNIYTVIVNTLQVSNICFILSYNYMQFSIIIYSHKQQQIVTYVQYIILYRFLKIYKLCWWVAWL